MIKCFEEINVVTFKTVGIFRKTSIGQVLTIQFRPDLAALDLVSDT